MADTLQPSDEDRDRTAAVASAFAYLVGDLLAGVDGSPRIDSTTVRSDGLLGPVSNQPSVAYGTDGAVYVRGQSGMYQRASGAAPVVSASAAGLSVSPGLLLLAAVAFFVLRK